MRASGVARIAGVTLLFALCIALLAGLYLIHGVSRNAPTAEKGRLDLSAWDFDRDGLLSLNGEWEFYDRKLLKPEDFRDVKNGRTVDYLSVPGTWSGLDQRNAAASKGYGTYRLSIVIDNSVKQTLALMIGNIRFANQLYVNGEAQGSSGTPSADEARFQPGNTPYYAFFDTDGDSIEVIIQTSNYYFPTGGIINAIPFGKAEDITILSNIRMGIDMGLILLLLFFGTYCLGLYALGSKSTSYLLIGFYMYLVALNHSLYNEKVFQRLLPDLRFEWVYKLQEIGQFAGGILFWYFIASFGIRLMSDRWRLNFLYPIYAYLAAVVILPYNIHIQIKYIFAFYLSLIPVIVLWRLFILFVREREVTQRKEIGLVIGTCVALEGHLVSTFMYAENLLESDFWGKCFLLLFILLMLLVLTARYARSQRQLEQLSEQLLLSNQLKDEFLLNTSHELKTPLHGIRNMVSNLLEDAAAQLNAKQKQQMWLIQDTTTKLNMLVQDLIDVTSLKHGKLQLTFSVIDVKVAVGMVLELLRFELMGKSVRMENETPRHLMIVGDENRFRQVLYNLVHNAIKHTERGSIRVGAKRETGGVAIWVADTGNGISPDRHEAIFRYFVQGDNQIPQDGYSGMGVGLYISRQLVELMGGRIEVEWSEIGRGTRMRVVLPEASGAAAQAEPVAGLSASQRPLPAEGSLDIVGGHGQTIMIVDDEASNIHILLNLLDRHAYNVITAFSAHEALVKLEQYPRIDLIILDVMMPETSGIELCRTLRSEHSILDLPILFATVKDAPQDIALGFRAGANDYITKPFDSETLLARIQTLLAMKSSIRAAIRNELAFHQAQIKPHFLYNALSSVITFCYVDAEKAAYLLTMLSRYLRFILDTDRTTLMITLRQELELIEAYVEIEQARFGDRFRFQCRVEDETSQTLVPSLCIQPFIENAIRHGLFDKVEPGTVALTIAKDKGEYIRITVTDDGVGMSEERLEQIRTGTLKEGGIAIANIVKRIGAIPDAEIAIHSAPELGTKVVIRLPAFLNTE